jgi:hypothetical protein
VEEGALTTDGGLRPLFRQHLRDFMWTSIETGLTTPGVSDSHYQHRDGAEGWVEHKQTDGWAVTLDPEQIGWITQGARYGGRRWIAVRRRHDGGPRLGPAVDELWMMPGRLAIAAKELGLRGVIASEPGGVFCWPGGPGQWAWTEIRRLLIT